MHLKIGTRASPLALTQTHIVINALKHYFPHYEYEIVEITTTGDRIQNKTLYEIGGKALFLKELEMALVNGEIDLAVHSYKDVPGALAKHFTIAAVLPRTDPYDCFVSNKYKDLQTIPAGKIIGSSSPRRRALLHHIRPDLVVKPIRGRIETRLQKIRDGEFDATLLASCGLSRMNYFEKLPFYQILPVDLMLPAVGQGAICLETLANNQDINAICQKINHEPTATLLTFERSFLKNLHADCKTPAAAYATFEGNKVRAQYMLADFDSLKIKFFQTVANLHQGLEVGLKASKYLKKFILT